MAPQGVRKDARLSTGYRMVVGALPRLFADRLVTAIGVTVILMTALFAFVRVAGG